jgi:hypothetical protein
MRRFFIRRRGTRHDTVGHVSPIAALAAAALMAFLAWPPTHAGAEQLVKAGAANRPLLIREHAAWNMDCRAIPYPALHLDQPPQHGAVCARVADIMVRSMYAGTEAQCIGRVVQGLRLIYVPQPGFTGRDRLQYSVQYPSAHRSVSVTVSVGARAGTQLLPLDTVGTAPDMGQMPGPVPPCAAPLS